MKYFKDILSEVSQPKAPEEKRFKDQHEIETIDHPVALDSQFSGDIEGLTSKKREADYDKGEDQKAYDKAYKKKVSQTLPKRGTTITTDQEDVLEDIDLDALLDFNEGEMTVEELDEVIGTIKKVANRFTTAGRADAAERKVGKMVKKDKDKARLAKAKERLKKAKDAKIARQKASMQKIKDTFKSATSKLRTADTEVDATNMVKEATLTVNDFTGKTDDGNNSDSVNEPSSKKGGLRSRIKIKTIGSGRFGGDKVQMTGSEEDLISYAKRHLGGEGDTLAQISSSIGESVGPVSEQANYVFDTYKGAKDFGKKVNGMPTNIVKVGNSKVYMVELRPGTSQKDQEKAAKIAVSIGLSESVENLDEASPTAWTNLRNDQRDRVRQEYQKLKAEYEKAQEKHDYHYNDIEGDERTADRMMDRMEMIKDKQDKLVQKYGRGVYKAVGFRTGNRANEEMSITEILGFKNKTKEDDEEAKLNRDKDVEEDVCTNCKDPHCKDGKCEEDIIEDDSEKAKDDSVDTNTSSLEDQPKEAPKVKAPKPSPTSVNIKAGGKNIQLTFKEMLDKVSSEDELLESPQEEIPMMLKQLQFICYASEEISEYLQSGVDPEEWWQNKLAGVFSNVKSLYAWSKGDQLVNKPLSAAAMFDKAGMKMHFEETEEELYESPVKMSGRNVKVRAGMLKTADGKRVKINKDEAKLLTDFFKNVKNVNNKKEMIDQLSQSEGGYKEVLTFAELS